MDLGFRVVEISCQKIPKHHGEQEKRDHGYKEAKHSPESVGVVDIEFYPVAKHVP
jgi:hypothetical protein